MGPITLFDKSFLQSLSVDESVWFDHFFYSIVCPIFYVETLADLGKPIKNGINPEHEVKKIADKFPEAHGNPCAFHLHLCMNNLLGINVPMGRGIPQSGGRLVKEGEKSGVVYDIAPESKAFNRWSNQEFASVERQYACDWRLRLSSVNLEHVASTLRLLGVDSKLCKDLESAKLIAESAIKGGDKLFDRLKLVCYFLRIPEQYHTEIVKKWHSRGYPLLESYAPYAVYVAILEVFFHVAISANLISADRPSNLMDIAYLNYLPFSDIFVSSDKIHKKCAPIFQREGQLFIWGPDLKKGLNELNNHYNLLPSETKEKGIGSFALTPPKEGSFYVSDIWDKCFSNWRNKKEYSDPEKVLPQEFGRNVQRMANAPALPKDKIDFDPQNPDSLLIQRSIHRKRGSWYQFPKNFEKK